MLKACLFLCLLLPLIALCQVNDAAGFRESKRAIDSLCRKINKNTLIKKALIEFSRDEENFVSNGFCYADTASKELKKFIFNDVEHNLAADTFYFDRNILIKVTGKNYIFYNTGNLQDDNGEIVPAEKAKNIVEAANLALDAMKDIKRYFY